MVRSLERSMLARLCECLHQQRSKNKLWKRPNAVLNFYLHSGNAIFIFLLSNFAFRASPQSPSQLNCGTQRTECNELKWRRFAFHSIFVLLCKQLMEFISIHCNVIVNGKCEKCQEVGVELISLFVCVDSSSFR